MTREQAIKQLNIWAMSGYAVPVVAIQMAIEALSAVAEWIPCNERLPEESGTYLTTTAKGSVCTDHFYANSNDICGRHWSYHRRREPIAWMPLPPAYREESEV